MRRCLASALLVVLATALSGCGLVLFSAVEPDPQLFPRPGTYREAIYVEPDRRNDQDYYWSADPNASMSEFEWLDRLLVTRDTTFRFYTINRYGLRSPIVEASYVIEDESAPAVSAPILTQTSPSYWTYGVVWNATPPGTGDTVDPSDDVTPADMLEYAVFSSASDNLDTAEEAMANGRLELTWRSWWELDQLSWDARSGVFMDYDAGRIGLRYTAGRPGEQRFFNVFVRDGEGNATGYGTKRFASRSAQSIYVAEGGGVADRIQLNNAVDVSTPGGEPSYTSYSNSPRADGNASFQFGNTVHVALGRIDDDAMDDLAIIVQDGSSNVFRWYSAVGNGRYDGDAPAVELMTDVADGLPRKIAISDFTGDGVAEIIVSTTDGVGAYALRVYDRSGTGKGDVGADARDFATGDITGNGLADVVSWDTTTGAMQVWINGGDAALNLVAQSWTPPSGFTHAALADINNDGKDDLILSTPTTPVPPDTAIELYLGTATGALSEYFGEEWFRSGATPLIGVTCVTPIDFNRDGWLDVFVGTTSGSSLQLNNGDGTFAPFFETGTTGANDAVVFDANGDGWPDIIESFSANSPILWLNLEGLGIDQSPLGIGSAATTMIATGRVR